MKKASSIILAVLLLISMLCGCGSLEADGLGTSPGKKDEDTGYIETQKVSISGKVDTDGNGIVPLQDGTCRSVSGDGYSITLTEDRNTAVFLETDGLLSISRDEKKTKVDTDVRSVYYVRNDAILYSKLLNNGKMYPPGDYSYDSSSDNEYTYYRYSIITGETVELMFGRSLKMAKNTGTVLYSTYNEETEKYTLSRLMADSLEYEVLATSSEELMPAGISDDGSIYSWCERSGDEYAIYLSVNDEREKAYTTESMPSWFNISFNRALDFAVITSGSSDYMAFWTADNGMTKVKLSNELYSGIAFTDTGSLAYYDDVSAGALYICTDEGDRLKNLYAITLDGNREKIASNVTDWDIRSGYLYYITEDGDLQGARLNNGIVSDETKIAAGVCDLTVSPDGSAVAYVRDVANDSIGSLYYYKFGDEKPVRIEGESYCFAYYYSYIKYWTYSIKAAFTNDGKGVYYFTDSDVINGTSTYTGTLYLYNLESAESVRIGADAVTTLTSEYVKEYPESSDIWYYKYISLDEDDNIICDLMYWNGSDTPTKIAGDVIYN